MGIWYVRSNSYNDKDISISGDTLSIAIENNVERIVKTILPIRQKWKLKSVDADWVYDLFRGNGGVELTLNVFRDNEDPRGGEEDARFICWIQAVPSDMTEHLNIEF